jgi:hypothetical protein
MLVATTTTKWSFQSLIGTFSFVAKALPGARPFFRSLIDSTRGLTSPYAKTVNPAQLRTICESGNASCSIGMARSMATGGPSHHPPRRQWGRIWLLFVLQPPQLQPSLAAAAAPTGVYTAEHAAHNDHSIQYGELLAIASSVSLYGPHLRDQALLVITVNISDVHIINRQRTKSPELLALLRAIYRVYADYNIDIRVQHIPGVENVVADLLSRPALHKHCARVPPTISQSPLCIRYVHSSSLELANVPIFRLH